MQNKVLQLQLIFFFVVEYSDNKANPIVLLGLWEVKEIGKYHFTKEIVNKLTLHLYSE